MSRTSKAQQADRAEAIAELRYAKWLRLRPGDTLYTIVMHVARSGMLRRIRLYIIRKGEPINISRLAARAIGWRFHEEDSAVVMPGAGMDMGFHLAYTLGRVLFPEGGALEKSVREGQERRAGAKKECDGGYLIRHRWM